MVTINKSFRSIDLQDRSQVATGSTGALWKIHDTRLVVEPAEGHSSRRPCRAMLEPISAPAMPTALVPSRVEARSNGARRARGQLEGVWARSARTGVVC